MQILALDFGTTSARGILYGSGGRALDMHSVSTPLQIDRDTGYIEQSPVAFQGALMEICAAIAARNRVDALSLTAFRSAPTLVDRNGEALTNFIMWQDTRNSDICRRLEPTSGEIYRRSGARLNTVFTASKLTWLKENAPELWRRAFKAMVVPDYLLHCLTGSFATDLTYGSRTHLMDIQKLCWDEELLRLFDIESGKLCELRGQGTVFGGVTEAFAARTGLKAGTPVVSAGGDQQCGALGLGVLDGSSIEVNSGTGSFVISLTDRPLLENEAVITNVAAVPGMYTQEMNIIASASALNWLIREFFPEYWGDAPDFEAVNRLAAQTPPGSHGLCAVPLLQGCGSRDWNPEARAIFAGFSLNSKRSDLPRALYEGIAAEIAKSIDALPESCRQAGYIDVAGGLSRADVYCRILADMTGRTLRRGDSAQATALGAYISAAVALGEYADYRAAFKAVRGSGQADVFAPDPETAEFYQGYKERTERLYRAERG